MQLTHFDRWLRVRFVNEIHIYTIRQPPDLPKHILAEELPDTPGRQFRFRYVLRKAREADGLIETLKENRQMFTTRVVDRKAWYVPLIAPAGKSFTWRCIWIVISVISLAELRVVAMAAWSNPEFQKNLQESLKTLKG
jgi:hypothetical protein